ncbi:YqiA/YcfP family alpha/beta fold hydrolase [Geitlerinema sp. PCC 9228]|jgi:hypothetical protein|uniref:YqiA/YcfP family alpha/beta fold hydrolase n=1 Tax=Geitlerinema sp. PCC 9228 TaxID=111611 RepID=UPI0008F9A206|nr:YqiA/YcfP family alpha/beta fold hydrolase [Geitlerinema sp. PCC 9228]
MYIYLHGFASGPQSRKARYLSDRFADWGYPLTIPDLNQGDFYHLTLTRQLQQVAALLPQSPQTATLIGSSFGGLTAAWLAEKYPQVRQIILLAPAFQFLDCWLPTLSPKDRHTWQTEGKLSVYHHAYQQPLPLHHRFLTDLRSYRESQLQRPVPTLLLHGRHDEVISIEVSRQFAKTRSWVTLQELDSDHALVNVLPEIWQATREFCQRQAPSQPNIC